VQLGITRFAFALFRLGGGSLFFCWLFPSPAKELGAMGIIRTEMEHSTQQRKEGKKERRKKGAKENSI
jgi:hypothetical protein